MARKPKAPARHRAPWSPTDHRLLKRLVKRQLSAAEVAAELGRSVAAIRQRAQAEGISFRAARRR
jgi:biotin operon repressor